VPVAILHSWLAGHPIHSPAPLQRPQLLHEAPSSLSGYVHSPALQVAPTMLRQSIRTVQMVLPFPQTPFEQVASRVQGSPSSQTAPLFLGICAEQSPVCGLHTPGARQVLAGQSTPVQQSARHTPFAHLVNPAQQGASTVTTLPSAAQHAPAWHAWPGVTHRAQVPPPVPQASALRT
jgi:hypothetical protein